MIVVIVATMSHTGVTHRHFNKIQPIEFADIILATGCPRPPAKQI